MFQVNFALILFSDKAYNINSVSILCIVYFNCIVLNLLASNVPHKVNREIENTIQREMYGKHCQHISSERKQQMECHVFLMFY